MDAMAQGAGRSGSPADDTRRKLFGGGRIRTLSRHMVEKPHPGITTEIVAQVLDSWLVRGIRTDVEGRQSWSYFAYAPDLEKLVRVVVSMDGATIVSAFQDGNATRAWNRGDRTYFARAYESVRYNGEPAAHI